jgi:competence protein ComEA
MKPLVAIVIGVAALAGFVAWHSRPAVSPIGPQAPVVVASPALLTTAPASSAATSPDQLMVVAVQGRVRHPGLVKLSPGARIADAIDAAGGVLPGTDLSYVNLAQKVADGQLIVISKSGPAGGDAGSPAGTAGGSSGSGQPINLNTATASDFDTLPGIGPELAARIVAYRTQHGAFRTVDELRSVSGIGDSKFAEIKDLVTV